MVDGCEGVQAQQLSQHPRVNLVRLVFTQFVLSRIAHQKFGDMRMDDVREPMGVGAFLEGCPNCSSLTLDKIDNGRGLVSRTASPINFPYGF